MLSVSFSVGSPTPYKVPYLELPGLVHQIQADFEDGENLFTSSNFTLGTFRLGGDRELIGSLTFRYTYDSGKKIIRVCGTNYPSADGMTMMTTPWGMDETCIEHAAAAGFLAEEVYRNGRWNYHSPLMPGAPQKIKEIVRAANDALIAALIAVPDHVVEVRETAPELPVDDYLALCSVSREDGSQEKYDPRQEYGLNDEVHTLFSQFGGMAHWNPGYHFANVIGSTDDPKPPGSPSWIRLWIATFERIPTQCTSLDFPRVIACNNDSGLVGGHVIPGQKASEVVEGSYAVHIFPICKRHNGNDNVFMRIVTEEWGVKLRKYLH